MLLFYQAKAAGLSSKVLCSTVNTGTGPVHWDKVNEEKSKHTYGGGQIHTTSAVYQASIEIPQSPGLCPLRAEDGVALNAA